MRTGELIPPEFVYLVDADEGILRRFLVNDAGYRYRPTGAAEVAKAEVHGTFAILWREDAPD